MRDTKGAFGGVRIADAAEVRKWRQSSMDADQLRLGDVLRWKGKAWRTEEVSYADDGSVLGVWMYDTTRGTGATGRKECVYAEAEEYGVPAGAPGAL